MKNDLGFFVLSFENNDYHSKICKLIADYIHNHKDKQIILFNQFFDKIDINDIPIMPLSHSKYFDGDLVVFDIQSLILANGSVKSQNIYFYAQNIPWQLSYASYSDWEYVFKKPRIKTIAQNQELLDTYQILWNNTIGICEEITYDKFRKFI